MYANGRVPGFHEDETEPATQSRPKLLLSVHQQFRNGRNFNYISMGAKLLNQRKLWDSSDI